MRVSLISVSQPEASLRERGIKSAEDLIMYCARVSSEKNQLNTETAPRLLKYCLDHKHVSIFETAVFTVEIETSRAIAAQILRHRSFTFQEFSQRYADPSGMGFETYEARRQDTKNRQNSIDDMDPKHREWFQQVQGKIQENSKFFYDAAVARGIAKEQARFLLPLSTTTRLYMTGNVRSWITYLQVRTDPSTQKEHREVAEAIKAIFVGQFPVIAEALGWKS